MKLSGATRPFSGCSQRTSASRPGDPTVEQREDRLVVQAQLVALDRAVEIAFDVQVLGG